MTELDRVGNSDNINFRGFHRFKHSQAMRKKKKMECVHDAGSAIYL